MRTLQYIYDRLFSLGALSNSLRNLLEVDSTECNLLRNLLEVDSTECNLLRNLLEYSAPVALTIPFVKSYSEELVFFVTNFI